MRQHFMRFYNKCGINENETLSFLVKTSQSDCTSIIPRNIMYVCDMSHVNPQSAYGKEIYCEGHCTIVRPLPELDNTVA